MINPNGFFATGIHMPTMTTVDDPLLRIYFNVDYTDDYLVAYVGHTPIDSVSVGLYTPAVSKINKDVLALPIYNGDPDETVNTHIYASTPATAYL